MGWLYLGIILFALLLIVELLGVTGLVICLLVTLAYGVAAMAIINMWQVKVYFEGVFRALKCFAIAFVLLMATWSPYRPPYLFYAAYFALLIFLSFRLIRKRIRAEKAIKEFLEKLTAITEDVAHSPLGGYRSLRVYSYLCSSKFDVHLFANDEIERFIYNKYGNDRFGGFPAIVFCYAEKDTFPYILSCISKAMQAQYPKQFKKYGQDGGFELTFK